MGTESDPASILLTGGTGFVGRHLVPALAARFPRARLVNLARPGEALSPPVETVSADLGDAAAVDAALAHAAPDMVLHLAAQSSVGLAAGAAAQTWGANALGTLNLARAIAAHAPRATVLFASTGEVYGAAFKGGLVDEETPPAPLNAYSASKLAGEWILRDVLPASARLIVARAFNHTGPGQDERFVLPTFAAQVARIEAGLAEPRLMTGNLEAERDFLDVRDVVDAYLRLLTIPDLPARTLVLVASGRAQRIGDLLEAMRGQARRPFQVELDPARLRPSDILRAVGRADRLSALTGWTPRYAVDDLVGALLEHWRERVSRGEGQDR